MLKFNLVVHPNPQTRGVYETFMPSPPYFIDLEEAREISNQFLPKISQEIVSLDEASNRILSEDLQSLVDDPPFDNSAMDGFAIKYLDIDGATKKNPVKLKLVSISSAGAPTNIVLKHGECIQCMTGAQIPAGADSIIMVEKTSGFNDEKVVKLTIFP